jgi:hypothetical protein
MPLPTITTLDYSNKIILPPTTISYQCSCNRPNKNAICAMYLKHGLKKSPDVAISKPLVLPGGWIVRATNCKNNMTYHLTRGSILFSGKKLLASYGTLASITGYVYHVTPNLPFTEKSYSLIFVNNPAIMGIDFTAKNSGWHCGSGNSETICDSKINMAQCYVGSHCNFIYKK